MKVRPAQAVNVMRRRMRRFHGIEWVSEPKYDGGGLTTFLMRDGEGGVLVVSVNRIAPTISSEPN